MHTFSHEVILYLSPIAMKNFKWDINFTFSKIDNYVDELAPGVESIYIGGFTTPQVRAGIGSTYPVIYGDSFLRDGNGKLVVEDDPGSPYYGFPKTADPNDPYKVYVSGIEEMEGLVEDQGPLVMYIDPATYEVTVPEKIISSVA